MFCANRHGQSLTHSRTRSHTHTLTHAHTHIRTHTLTFIHSRTLARLHTHTKSSRAHTHTHSLAQTQTNKPISHNMGLHKLGMRQRKAGYDVRVYWDLINSGKIQAAEAYKFCVAIADLDTKGEFISRRCALVELSSHHYLHGGYIPNPWDDKNLEAAADEGIDDWLRTTWERIDSENSVREKAEKLQQEKELARISKEAKAENQARVQAAASRAKLLQQEKRDEEKAKRIADHENRKKNNNKQEKS